MRDNVWKSFRRTGRLVANIFGRFSQNGQHNYDEAKVTFTEVKATSKGTIDPLEVVENNGELFRRDATDLTIFLQIVHMTKRTYVRHVQGPSPWTVEMGGGNLRCMEPQSAVRDS
jgi:hypothetical protein